jgi:hypothetical protein
MSIEASPSAESRTRYGADSAVIFVVVGGGVGGSDRFLVLVVVITDRGG